jgi:hypothetical protein
VEFSASTDKGGPVDARVFRTHLSDNFCRAMLCRYGLLNALPCCPRTKRSMLAAMHHSALFVGKVGFAVRAALHKLLSVRVSIAA